MPTVQEVAVAYYRQQQTAARLTAVAIERAWSGLDPTNLSQSYAASVGPSMVSVLTAGQQLAASTAQPYVAASVEAQGGVADAVGTVSPSAFGGFAADGRSLASLLYLPVIGAKLDIAAGGTVENALASSMSHLLTIVDTEVADAGRGALSAGITADRTVHGYVRMVGGNACSRCIVLAGKFYRHNASFLRHPRCSCTGIPSIENRPDFRTDPHAFFDHLSPAEQDARFGVADARAIREGADMFQVVNAHRGLTERELYGRTVQTTTEGMTRRGLASQRIATTTKAGAPRIRLSVGQIMADAGDDRDLAISLLKKYAYIF